MRSALRVLAVDPEERLVLVEQVVLGDHLERRARSPDRHRCRRASRTSGRAASASGGSNSPVRPPGWTGMSNVANCSTSAGYERARPHQDRDVAVGDAVVVVEVEDHVSRSSRPPRRWVSADQTRPTRPLSSTSRSGSICLSSRFGIVWANAFAASMISGRLRRFVEIENVCDVGVALGEAGRCCRRPTRATGRSPGRRRPPRTARRRRRSSSSISRSWAGLTSWYSSTIRCRSRRAPPRRRPDRRARATAWTICWP